MSRIRAGRVAWSAVVVALACGNVQTTDPDGAIEPADASSIPVDGAVLDGARPDVEIDAVPPRWALVAGNAATSDSMPPVATQPIRLYVPTEDDQAWVSVWTSDELDWVRSLASADYDGDGDVDF